MLRVLLDANLIVSFWTLDVVLTMADEYLLEPMWSDEVINEFRRAAAALGRSAEGVERVIADMERAYPKARIRSWSHHLGSITLPDPDDRHVVAAALEGGCDHIATFNLKDFPEKNLNPLGLCAIHPDKLMLELIHEDPEAVLLAMQRLVADKKRPPRTMETEITGLRKCGLNEFSSWLEARCLEP